MLLRQSPYKRIQGEMIKYKINQPLAQNLCTKMLIVFFPLRFMPSYTHKHTFQENDICGH